jgi:arylsulfate sulfotransferase
MRLDRGALCTSAVLFVIVASLGCGSPNTTPSPLGSITPTANPLVAQYTIAHFHSGLSGWVEFGTDTTYGRQTSPVTSTVTAVPGKPVNILVAGMKPQTTYHMRAHVTWSEGSWVDEDHAFTTGALPQSTLFPQFIAASTVQGGSTLSPAPGIELLSLASTIAGYVNAVATDLQGNVIWYCPGAAIPVKLMPNGHYIVNRSSDLQEVDLACNTIRDVSATQVNQSLQAQGYTFGPITVFHHDMLVLPNGHWIALANIERQYTDLAGYPGTTNVIGDALLDIDPDGNVVWAWSGFDHLDINRHPYFGLPDWTHSNALVYTADGNLLLSVRAQSWILKIDYANGTGTGNVLWKLGPEGDFTLLGGDPTEWFYSQHYPNLLNTSGSQMSIAVWDNGDYRTDAYGVQCGTSTTAPPCYSRAVTLTADESTNVADLDWQDLPGFYSNWGGSIAVLSNGNVEFDLTNPFNQAASQIMEVTQSGTPQTVWQLNINGAAAYRGNRVPSLYPGVTWQK